MSREASVRVQDTLPSPPSTTRATLAARGQRPHPYPALDVSYRPIRDTQVELTSAPPEAWCLHQGTAHELKVRPSNLPNNQGSALAFKHLR